MYVEKLYPLTWRQCLCLNLNWILSWSWRSLQVQAKWSVLNTFFGLIRVIIIDFVSEWCMDIVTILSNSEEMYRYYRIETPKLALNSTYIFFKIYLYVILYKNSNDPLLYDMHIKWTYFNVVWYIHEMRNFTVTIRAKKVIPTGLNNENLKRGACFLANKVISELRKNRSLQK